MTWLVHINDVFQDCSGRKRRDAEKPLSDDQDYNRVTSRIRIETPKTYELELKSLLSSESTSLGIIFALL